jgi:Cu2+-exporting ATPase
MMKTSVIEVRDMLSVLSAPGVEKKIGEVPGVESVTVNYAAGNATVRYDETRLNVADIRSDVRQSGYESTPPAAAASAGDGHEGHTASGAPSATAAPAAPKSVPDATAAAPAGVGQPDKAVSPAVPTSVAPKSTSSAAAAASAVPSGDAQKDKAAPDKS